MKKCLIIVDFQNDFVTGSLGFEKAKNLEQIIKSKIEIYLNNNDDIIFTFDTHDINYLNTQEGKNLPIEHCMINTFGHEIYGEVNNYLNKAKKVFYKNTFGSLELANFLNEKNYSEIELVGLVTNMCILSNAVLAKSALPEALINIDSNAVMSFDDKLHNETLNILKGLQMNIK